MAYENSPVPDGNVPELEARGAEPDSSRPIPVLVVLLGALTLMVGTIIVAVPHVLRDAQILIVERQNKIPTPQLDTLRAAEAEALGTPKKLDNGLFRIPIAAGKAALLANPALLASLGATPAAAADPASSEDAPPMSEEELVAAGQALFSGPKFCMSCHKADSADRLVGPGLKGLFGREEKLADGTMITVDEAYVRESLLQPNAKVVEGFPPAMTPQTFTDAELNALVAYLKTL